MDLYFIRHGQSKANAQHILQGFLDSPLSELGKSQASALHGVLPELDTVIASPLLRAAQTANLATGKQPVLMKEFMELDIGNLEGVPFDDVKDDQAICDYLWLLDDSHYNEYAAESHSSFTERARRGLHQVLEQYREESTVAIFSHGGTMRSLLSSYLKLIPVEEARFSNTDVVHITYNDGNFRLIDYRKADRQD